MTIHNGTEWGGFEQNIYACMEILNFLKMEKYIWSQQKHFAKQIPIMWQAIQLK